MQVNVSYQYYVSTHSEFYFDLGDYWEEMQFPLCTISSLKI